LPHKSQSRMLAEVIPLHPDHLLTVKELSSFLGIHQATIYKMARSGSIPAYKCGGSWRFDLDTVLKKLEVAGG